MGLTTLIKNAYQNFTDSRSARRKQQILKNQILNDIKDFIKKHCPEMSLNAQYRNQLVRSINISLNHAGNIVSRFPGPIEMDPKLWEDLPLIHAMFLNPEQIRSLLKSSIVLKQFFEKTKKSEAIALLASSLQEKTVFTTEKHGEIIRRDVPRKAINFDGHQILVPAQNLSEVRYKMTHLALISLCSQIFKETTDLKSWKTELETQQRLLEFSIKDGLEADKDQSVEEVEQLLSEIKTKISSINNQINMTGEHLERITKTFESPDKHLLLETKTMKLNRLSILLDTDSTEPADEFSIAEFQFGQPPKRAGSLVRVRREFLL